MLRDRAIDGIHAVVALLGLANPVLLPTDDRAAVGSHPAAPLVPVADFPEIHGVSDLAFDPAGRAWMVTERAHTLVPVLGGEPLGIEGVPPGLDLEALAFVGPGEWLVGTERHGARTHDIVLEGRLEAGRAWVVGERRIEWAELGLEAAPNQGVEGMCAAGEHLVLALETPRVEGPRRWGPLVVDGVVVLLELGSATGKIAALACALDGPDTLTVWALERHYGVSRLLRARLDLLSLARPPAPPTRVQPELWTNLSARIARPLPNIEGLAIGPDGLWLVNDDQPSPAGILTRVFRLVTTSARAGS
jgi:hypothetical protein